MELAEQIARVPELESVELIGLCTDICVISNAMILKARLPETPVFVRADCCAGVTPESHENAAERDENVPDCHSVNAIGNKLRGGRV